jgi:hypothetical protein
LYFNQTVIENEGGLQRKTVCSHLILRICCFIFSRKIFLIVHKYVSDLSLACLTNKYTLNKRSTWIHIPKFNYSVRRVKQSPWGWQKSDNNNWTIQLTGVILYCIYQQYLITIILIIIIRDLNKLRLLYNNNSTEKLKYHFLTIKWHLRNVKTSRIYKIFESFCSFNETKSLFFSVCRKRG